MVFSDNDILLRCWLSEFKIKNQNLSYQLPKSEFDLWVFWSDLASSSSSTGNCAIKINSALQTLALYYKYGHILFQYWAPTTTTIGGRCFLTTSNQPFAVTQLDHKLLDYRRGSLDYEFNVDDSESEEDLGLLGRVFRHRLPELTPNVHYYSSKEYPQRQDALRCDIQCSLAWPVFEPKGQFCVGVLELVSTEAKDFFHTFEDACWELEKMGLKGFNPCSPLSEEICDGGLLNAIKEIQEVLKVVCINHELPLAQTWVPWRNFSAVGSPENVRCGGEVMFTLAFAHYSKNFKLVNERLCLQKGQGVAGKAYMSHNACFCGDVTRFSITEYPLAHWARYFGLASCFAICLRSEYTGDSDYVLEFFFPPSKTDGGGGDQWTLLNSLLATMKQHFRSFKIASGKELGEELDVQFVHFRTIVDSVQICQTARSPTRPEPFDNVGDMMQLHSSDQTVDFPMIVDSVQMSQTARSPRPQPLQKVGDTVQLHSSEQFVDSPMVVDSTQICQTAVTYLEKGGTIEIPETEHRTTEISISYEVLKQHFGSKLEDAAESLSVSRSTLKRICRQHGVNRWPSHKRNKNNLSISEQNPPCSHRPSHTMPHEQAMQSVSTVTMKAKYKDDIIKFQLSCSSTMIELEEKVSDKLKLNVGTFKIKYEDDDDWILITSNEDLRDCITTSISPGNTTIRMLVQPITN